MMKTFVGILASTALSVDAVGVKVNRHSPVTKAECNWQRQAWHLVPQWKTMGYNNLQQCLDNARDGIYICGYSECADSTRAAANYEEWVEDHNMEIGWYFA